jgi:hypothetical protein
MPRREEEEGSDGPGIGVLLAECSEGLRFFDLDNGVHFTRKSRVMYTIQTRPHTYFTGTTKDGKQVLLGLLRDMIAVVIFDNMGDLLETREYPVNIDLKKGLGPAVETMVEMRIHDVRQLLTTQHGPITVNPFVVEKWNIALKQFPLDLEDYLEHPDRCSAEDAQLFRKDIEDWKSAGNCVLYWGNDYLLGRDGHTL